jgi:hypothetical protein
MAQAQAQAMAQAQAQAQLAINQITRGADAERATLQQRIIQLEEQKNQLELELLPFRYDIADEVKEEAKNF